MQSKPTPARKAVSKSLRFEIFKRDNFTCQYCGGHPPAKVLHLDHIHPVSAGGGNTPDNLVTACSECNLGKGAGLLSVVPQSLEEQAAEVAEREAQIRGYQEVMDAKRQRIEDAAWRVAEVLDYRATTDGYRRDWLTSIKLFVERMGLHEVLDAAEIAVAKRAGGKAATFRYFCGVCWGKLREAGHG